MKQFFFGSSMAGKRSFNIGWLLFRFYIGITIAIGAGLPKMNQLSAPDWFVKQVSELGFTFPSPGFWAAMAAWGEFVGGLCIAIGFFTRFSALQLAIQFFVVSFIWYDNPLPMFGMYYQQLLFWGFVLIAFSGSGKFAIDTLIMINKKTNTPNPGVILASMLLLIFSLSSFSLIKSPTIQPAELNKLEGTWNGTLAYKDYSSNNLVVIPVKIIGLHKENNQKNRTWVLKFSFSKEPDVHYNIEYKINKTGTKISKATLAEKKISADGTLYLVTEERGKDGNDNKPCIIRHIIQLNDQSLIITKMVKFDNEAEYFQRNEYKVSK